MPGPRDHSYSRLVGWAKIILPLIGLGILSSLFLFSHSTTVPSDHEAFGSGGLDTSNKERITGPRFAGMTPSGIAIRLSADEASPNTDKPGVFNATALDANLEFPAGQKMQIIAKAGIVDSTAMLAKLSGGISLTTSDGYAAQTDAMSFALNRLEIRSLGPISATGPIGAITAGGMTITQEMSADGKAKQGYLLVFNNRVKLVYKPK